MSRRMKNTIMYIADTISSDILYNTDLNLGHSGKKKKTSSLFLKAKSFAKNFYGPVKDNILMVGGAEKKKNYKTGNIILYLAHIESHQKRKTTLSWTLITLDFLRNLLGRNLLIFETIA